MKTIRGAKFELLCRIIFTDEKLLDMPDGSKNKTAAATALPKFLCWYLCMKRIVYRRQFRPFFFSCF